MSYRQCFFAVPGADVRDALARFAEMAAELSSENGYHAVYLATSPEPAAQASGLCAMWLAAEPAPRGRVPRGFVTERWTDAPLFVAVYDDQHGIYHWAHYPKDGPPQSILSDGHDVGVRNLTLTVDYPQKGFTREQLAAAVHKPEAALSAAERRAVMEPQDALTIGLAQFGFRARRKDFLDLLYAKEAWSLLGTEPRMAALPRSAGAVVDDFVTPHTFKSHGLAPRAY
jgi:hypothetical protein